MLSLVCGVWVTYTIRKKGEKKKVEKNKQKRHELCEARTHAIKSKIEHLDNLTHITKTSIFLFFAAHARRATHRTHIRAQHSEKEREAVMTDDGSQPPIEQLATAVHRGSATRSWCGPLLLVLLGGVVMLLVFSARCLVSRFLM